MMKETKRYIVRIPTSNLKDTHTSFIKGGFKCIAYENDYLLGWYLLENQIIAIKECEDEYLSLVKYSTDSQKEINNLDSKGIITNFQADEFGKHFESSFFDPGGTKILIADYGDIPSEVLAIEESSSFELSIPSAYDFKDSVNFWYLLGFDINDTVPKPHPWASIIDIHFRIGIHQHFEWNSPGLCLSSASSIKKAQFSEAKLRSNLYFSDFFSPFNQKR